MDFDATTLGPSTRAMQAAGRLPSHTFLDLRSAKQGYLKSRKYPRDRRSRATTRCHCCYDYSRHQMERIKKAEGRFALAQEEWEDDHDLDGGPIPWEFLGYAWDQDLIWDENGPIMPPWALATDDALVIDGAAGDGDEEWDLVVSDDLSETWSIIDEDG